MFRFFRGVLAGFRGYVDLATRLEDLEDGFRRLRDRVEENEIVWHDEVDKLTSIHKRAVKRIQDGTQALLESSPTIGDMQLSRAARKAALRQRSGHGRTEAEG